MSKTWKFSLIGLTVVLIIAGIASLFYFRTKVNETCSQALNRYSSNHLCIDTNKGLMIFELYSDSGPRAVEKMTTLANDKKFFDGLEFYRVVKDFVIQAGIQDYRLRYVDVDIKDPVMKDRVDFASKENFDIETNFDKMGIDESTQAQLKSQGYKSDSTLNARKFEYGSLAFANQGDQNPNSNSTEFFIVSSRDPSSENVKYLNGRFTNFGKIVEGQSVLDKINNLDINPAYPFSSDKTHPFGNVTIFEIRVKQ